MKSVILILSVCAFAAAFVPRETEDQAPTTQQAVSSTTQKPICATETPCGWAIYNSVSKYIKNVIKNTFCDCDDNFNCEISEDNQTVNVFVMRCRPPRASSEDKQDDVES